MQTVMTDLSLAKVSSFLRSFLFSNLQVILYKTDSGRVILKEKFCLFPNTTFSDQDVDLRVKKDMRSFQMVRHGVAGSICFFKALNHFVSDCKQKQGN